MWFHLLYMDNSIILNSIWRAVACNLVHIYWYLAQTFCLKFRWNTLKLGAVLSFENSTYNYQCSYWACNVLVPFSYCAYTLLFPFSYCARILPVPRSFCTLLAPCPIHARTVFPPCPFHILTMIPLCLFHGLAVLGFSSFYSRNMLTPWLFHAHNLLSPACSMLVLCSCRAVFPAHEDDYIHVAEFLDFTN
jgi:hypothetical protein